MTPPPRSPFYPDEEDADLFDAMISAAGGEPDPDEPTLLDILRGLEE